MNKLISEEDMQRLLEERNELKRSGDEEALFQTANYYDEGGSLLVKILKEMSFLVQLRQCYADEHGEEDCIHCKGLKTIQELKTLLDIP